MSGEFTLTLNSPITEEQWDMIADVDFDYTNEITFHTKHGKTVRFVKESAQPEIIICKDCKHWNELLNICDRTKRLALGANGFCSRAERKEHEK